MGMQIGTNNANKVSITYQKPDGTPVGTLTMTKVQNSKSKKKKRLGYNFKRISTKIMMAKTSNGAGKVVREARGTLVTLLLKKNTGDFDDQELRHAITHAREMERVAKKRRKHMEEEEQAEHRGSALVEEDAGISENREEENEENELSGISAEELERLERELQQMMEESMEDLNELADELLDASCQEMDPQQIENMKKRHRADELRRIMEADMKYLKALFDRLSREKQSNTSGSDNAPRLDNGVSLELSGVEIPVESAPAPAAVEGAGVDVTV